MSTSSRHRERRVQALERVVAGNNVIRLAAGMLRRINTNPLTSEQWRERSSARMRGESVPRTPELTPAQWSEIAGHLRKAIERYDVALRIAEAEAQRR